MQFSLSTAQLYVPDGLSEKEAITRTTHMGIAAHQDDLEIMAIDGILRCFQHPDRWFSGVVVTNGSGSPRDDLYRDYTDEDMRQVRIEEQKKAALVGGYATQILLDHPSTVVKDSTNKDPVEDIKLLVQAARPGVIYTHNLADKHPSHVAVVLRVIEAIRSLPEEQRPQKLYGCEVWRNLDWLPDDMKVAFDCSARESLQMALLGVFDSQICGGKRYDLATMGRRRANATYFASHGVDTATGLVFAVDMTPLIADPAKDILAFIRELINRFSQDVQNLITDML